MNINEIADSLAWLQVCVYGALFIVNIMRNDLQLGLTSFLYGLSIVTLYIWWK